MRKKGFTIIEIMVVMAIIAVLSVLMIGAIQAARAASINTKRRGIVRSVETALESRYYKCGAYRGGPDNSDCNKTGVLSIDTGWTYPPMSALTETLYSEKHLAEYISYNDDTAFDVCFNEEACNVKNGFMIRAYKYPGNRGGGEILMEAKH